MGKENQTLPTNNTETTTSPTQFESSESDAWMIPVIVGVGVAMVSFFVIAVATRNRCHRRRFQEAKDDEPEDLEMSSERMSSLLHSHSDPPSRDDVCLLPMGHFRDQVEKIRKARMDRDREGRPLPPLETHVKLFVRRTGLNERT